MRNIQFLNVFFFLLCGCGHSVGDEVAVTSTHDLTGRRCMLGSPPNGQLVVDHQVEVKAGYSLSYCHGFLSFELSKPNPSKTELVVYVDEAYIAPDPALPPLDLTVEKISFSSMEEVETSEFIETGSTATLPLSSYPEVSGESIKLRIDVTDIIDPASNLQQFLLKLTYGQLTNVRAELVVSY